MLKIHFVQTKNNAHQLIKKYNESVPRPDHQPRGQVADRINNEEYAVKLIGSLANQFHKIKKGVLRVTRSYLAKAIDRTEPAVDRLLEKLEKAGILRKKNGVAYERFSSDSQAVGCIEIEILASDLFVFCGRVKRAIKLFFNPEEVTPQDEMEHFKFLAAIKRGDIDFQVKTPS